MPRSQRAKDEVKNTILGFFALNMAITFFSFEVSAQPMAEQRGDIEEILELSQVEEITSGMSQSLIARVFSLAGDLSLDEENQIRSAISNGFILEDLQSDIVDFMSIESEGDLVRTVLEGLRSGATSEIRRITNAHTPRQSIEEYAADFELSMLSSERLDLVSRWVAAQSAGDFYIILNEAEREIAYELLRALRGNAPDFIPLSRSEYEREHENQTAMAVLSVLHRFEAVSSELLREAISERESESGQWYIESYTFGISEALWLAGQRVARRLAGLVG